MTQTPGVRNLNRSWAPMRPQPPPITGSFAPPASADHRLPPADQNVTAEYPIVALKDAPNSGGATAFVNYVLGSAGQKVLQSFGFKPAGK